MDYNLNNEMLNVAPLSTVKSVCPIEKYIIIILLLILLQ